MALTIDEIKKIALLARIELSAEEEQRHAETISAVLDYMKRLGEVDTNGVEPTAQVTGLSNVYRADEARGSAIKEDLIKAMPDVYAGELRVPGVFENSES